MPPKGKQDLKKLENERLTALVMELLKEDENKYCADCEAKQPRWASWNLGVFLCIRCAGLHRNLGVHISKVKSVSLDTWLPEQVQSMRVMGNAKAKAVYEAELPSVFRRPQTDQALEHFIRAKYDAKRYILKGWIPPTVNVDHLPPLHDLSNKSTAPAKKLLSVGDSAASKHQNDAPKKQEANLFDLFDSDSIVNKNNCSSANQVDILGLDSGSPVEKPAQNDDNLDDLFGSMVTAPSMPAFNQKGNSTSSFTEAKNVDQLATGLESLDFNAPPKVMTNDDIMSLYNKPSPFNAGIQQQSAQPMQSNQLFTQTENYVGVQPNVMSMSHPNASFFQLPVKNCGTDGGFTSASANQTPSMSSSIQQKPACSAFDDLFATAAAHFSSVTPANNPQNTFPTKSQTPTTTAAAYQDLESLFM